MKSELQFLAELSLIDVKLDELQEDCGDLPNKIKSLERKYNEAVAKVNETQQILSDIKKFKVDSKLTLQALKEKEEKLAAKQFNVKNNKEFDAYTKEIDFTRSEFVRLTDELRMAGVKEENLTNMIESQNNDSAEAKTELDSVQKELDEVASDQNEELLKLKSIRKKIITNISHDTNTEYTRIRTLHHDAVMPVRKNSCSGCYSTIPAQKNVELRNNLDSIFYCENCGRIIYTDELVIDKEILDLIKY